MTYVNYMSYVSYMVHINYTSYVSYMRYVSYMTYVNYMSYADYMSYVGRLYKSYELNEYFMNHLKSCKITWFLFSKFWYFSLI